MILAQRLLVYILALLSIASILFLGIQGYQAVVEHPVGETQSKILAEKLLYCAIVLALVALAVLVLILVRSRSVARELDRIIETARRGGSLSALRLKPMGTIGEKLRVLYGELTELGYRQALKISSLTETKSFLLSNINMALVIADVTGRISDASRVFVEQAKAKPGDILGRRIQDILPALHFQDLVRRLERDHSVITQNHAREQLTMYPVLNRVGQLANIIFIWGKEAVFTEIVKKTERPVPPPSRVSSLLRRFMQPK